MQARLTLPGEPRVIGLVAAGLLLAGCGQHPAEPADRPDHRRLVAAANRVGRRLRTRALPRCRSDLAAPAVWRPSRFWLDMVQAGNGTGQPGDVGVLLCGRHLRRVRFVFEKVITADEAGASLPAEEVPDFATPCPEPEGGWRASDPDRSSSKDQTRVFAVARRLPGYGGSWVDDRGDPTQDPVTTVVNIRVTHAIPAAEQELRRVWGGPFCVSQAKHSEAQLRRTLDEVSQRPGVLGGHFARGFVDLEVIYDDGTLQRQLDDTFGAGLVEVDSALRPYVE